MKTLINKYQIFDSKQMFIFNKNGTTYFLNFSLHNLHKHYIMITFFLIGYKFY